MGKTHSKPLAARHGHGILCVNRPLLVYAIKTPSKLPVVEVPLVPQSAHRWRDKCKPRVLSNMALFWTVMASYSWEAFRAR